MDTTKEKLEQVELIRGSFSSDEAKDILMNLINSKINFHEVKSFSKMIRMGIPEEQSLQRIDELKASREKILEYLNSLSSSNEIILKSTIEITLKK